ncbi:MAG: MarR family transcriptional regulator [Rhodobacteraceae bacterium PARR1]|nr:MAG: MarR family transcriptional regulator [Rhodobacteraceae bacterium PARR1]
MKQDHSYLGTLLQTAARKLFRQFESQTADHGLSAAQWRLLGHLLKQGPSTQIVLADLLEVEPISVSRLIDRMEQAGWLRREAHPDDRRARIIVATDKARATAPGVKAIAEALSAQALDGLTEDERRIFLTALRQVATNMDRMTAAPESAAHPEFEKTT